MTIEEAIELVLSGEGVFECMSCDGDGAVAGNLCFACEGPGRLASNELFEAHRVLELPPPDLESYEKAKNYAYIG
jgi:hypothetical protein